jgi:general secretion pathway protein N
LAVVTRLTVGTVACAVAAWACGHAPAEAAAAPAKPRPAAPEKRLGNPLWGVPVGALSATRERPLFSPSRRPPAVAVAAPPPSALPPPPAPPPAELKLTLVGTVIGSAGSIGVFSDPANKATVRLRVGEGHDSWILRAIDAHAAKFERDRREVTLVLPGRNGLAQQGTVIPALVAPVGLQAKAPPGPAPAPPGPRVNPPVRPPWMDQGSSPQRAASRTALENPPAAAWLDDEGQMVSPPPGEVR